jgi:hypothetical protein
VLPWIILAAVAVPLLLAAGVVARRKTRAGESTGSADTSEQARIEQEFAAADAYEAQWREQDHERHPPESLY